MADLRSNIDFKVVLNIKAGTVTISDIPAAQPFPADIIAATVDARIIQPDGASRKFTITDPGTPGLLHFIGSRKLAFTTDGRPQNGKYTVILTVKTAGYTDTVITKIFQLKYQRPTPEFSKNFNLLLPALSIKDETIYNIFGLTNVVANRSWHITAGAVGSFDLGNLITADLLYNGNYYSSEHTASLTTELVYTLTDYPFVTVIDEMTGDIVARARKVPAFEEFPAMLMEIGELSGADLNVDCCKQDCKSEDYKTAFILYDFIKNNICGPSTSALRISIDKFLTIFYRYHGTDDTLNTVISAFDYSFCETAPNGGDTGNHIRNMNSGGQQTDATINIDGSITAAGIDNGDTANPLFVIKDGAGKLYYLTLQQMQTIFAVTGALTQWGGVGGTLGDQTDLAQALSARVVANGPITGGKFTKLTVDAKGLATLGEQLTAEDIPTIGMGQVFGLGIALGGKAPMGHTHAIDDVNGLGIALTARALNNEVVHKAGDENISGRKSFAVSPSAPTPINGPDVANKAYVDLKISEAGIEPGEGGPGILTVETKDITTNDTYTILNGQMIDKIVLFYGGTTPLNVGVNPGGSEIDGIAVMNNGDQRVIDTDVAAYGADKIIYFSAVVAPIHIVIYLRALAPLT